MGAVLPHQRAVHEHMRDAGGRRRRLLEGGTVDHPIRIEDADIGIGARRDAAAVGEAKTLGGKAGHAPNGFLERE